MAVINHIPNYEKKKDPIPTPGICILTENDVRITPLKKYALEHLDIMILDEISWGSEWWGFGDNDLSSSTSPEYPMATVIVFSAKGSEEMVEHILDPMIENNLPGSKNGPLMTSKNYLTMSSHTNQFIPGDIEEELSSTV